jgi:predicted nucleic acid-binding protein
MLAWDTTLVSRVHVGGTLEQQIADQAQAGEPIAITAPTVMEVVQGLQVGAADDSRMALALAWFTRLASSDLVEVLPFDRPAAVVAGRLRALHPTPPSGARRKGVKSEQRAGWVLDIQIAACAWTHGRGIATDNLRDFTTLRELIADLYPHVSPLTVTTSVGSE